jgi:NADP-reducing hydrogenase subunit HndB
MERIRSIKDLEEARTEALHQENAGQHLFEIRISMGSCGIAAGANETLSAINQRISDDNLEEVQTKIIGCIGLCALEPIVQVVELGGQQVTYGKVDAAVVRRIFNEHIERHLIVQEYMVETN